MARHYGTIATAMWDDPEFRGLSANAQRVYMLLITQAGITSVGTLAVTLRRWSQYASDTPSDSLSNGLKELADRLFVVIDWDQEELLVRTFVRWDGGHTNPKRLAAIRSAAITISSHLLSGVLAYELNRLGVEHGITASPIDSHSIGNTPNADSPRSVVTYVSTSATHTPQTTNHTPHSATSAKADTRGARISDSFAPTEAMREWAATKCPGLNVDLSTEKFVNYWQGKSGREAVKSNWPATWRNWLLNDFERGQSMHTGRASPSQRVATSDQRVADGLDLARRLAQREAHDEQQQRMEIEA